MSNIRRTFAAFLSFGLVLGCDKPAEPKPPEPPKKDAATPPAPPQDGPKLPTPGAAPMSTAPLGAAPAATPAAPALPTPPTGPALTPPGAPPLGVPSAPAKSTAAEDLKTVQDVIAKQMKIAVEKVDPASTLDQLKIANVDLADIRVELESKLKIALPNSALQKAAGTDMPYEVVEKLTVGKLAETVTAIRAK